MHISKSSCRWFEYLYGSPFPYIPRIEYEKGLAEFPQALPAADQIDITSLWFGIRGDPYENRTRVSAVKGRCLNRLTNGPLW